MAWQAAHRLNEQEESEIRECFALFDRDKDGKIKIEELGLIMRSLGRAPTGRTNCEVLFPFLR